MLMKTDRIILLFSLFFLGIGSQVFSNDLPNGGKAFVNETMLVPDKLQVRHGGGKFGSSRFLTGTNEAFGRSLELKVTKRPPNTWDVGFRAQTTSPIKKGDHLVVGFWARGQSADASGGGVAELVFERHGAPYTKSIQYLVETPVSGEWKHYWVRLRSLEDYEPGQAVINFQAGYTECTFEIGGIEAWNFARRVKFDQLPHTALTYVGRELDAPWRAEAERRIERHRKADLLVTVVDAAGRPKPGAPVHVRLDRLAFDFGTAVGVSTLLEEGADADRYRQTLKAHFNLSVIENGLKWKHWDAYPSNQRKAIKALQWLKENRIPVRGHVMVWPGYRYLPPWIKALEKQPKVLRGAIDTHIREVGYATREFVRDWDVLNEVYDNRDLTNALGDEEMVHWFRVARQVAPNAKRYYNDYAGLVRGGFPTGHKDHFEKTIRYLIDNKAPLDGIGIQGHFGSLLTTPNRLNSELDRWAAFKKGILITEFDVTVPDAKLRADFTRDFMTVCFSHPAVKGIVTWGFWAGAQWRPESAFFDKNWNVTPMGAEWIKLTKAWRTDEKLITDANGQVKLKAFLGDYTVISGDSRKTFNHQEPGSQIRLPLSSK